MEFTLSFCFSKASIEAEVRRHLEAEKKAYIWVERLALVENIDEQECNTMVWDFFLFRDVYLGNDFGIFYDLFSQK